jgi:prepilin-type N-terminal cleavage/methylation domain-containing protein
MLVEKMIKQVEHSMTSRGFASGFTLLELLVSAAISTIVLTAAGQFYVAAQQASRYQSGWVALQETGTFALAALRQSFARAGAQGRLADGRAPASLAPVLWSGSGDGVLFDQVSVQYRTGPTGGYTCTGARAQPDTTYVSQYRVAVFSGGTSGATAPNMPLMQLVCRSAKLAQPAWHGAEPIVFDGRADSGIILAGVESFQVLYGVRSRSMVGQAPQRYVPSEAVDVSQDRVVTVKVALLLRTVDEVAVLSRAQAAKEPEKFQVLDAVWPSQSMAPSVPDRQLRRVFEAVFQLPNSNA